MLRGCGLLFVITIFIAAPVRGEEWASALADLLSTNQAVSDKARDRVFKVMLPRLQTEDAASARKEAIEVAAQLGVPDERIRVQASGVLATIATIRPDSSDVLHPTIQALLGRLQDQAARVRSNAVSTLSNMKPAVPNEALRPLIYRLHDEDARVASAAVYGVARSGDSAPEATQALSAVLNSTGKAEVKRAVVMAIAALHLRMNPTLTEGVGKALNDSDRGLVKETLSAVRMMKPEVAGKFRGRIETLANGSDDPEISQAASAVLNGLPRQE